MGTCASSPQISSSTIEGNGSDFQYDEAPLIINEMTTEHVRLMAIAVLKAFEQSLLEFEKNPHVLHDDTGLDHAPWMDSILSDLKIEFNPLVEEVRGFLDSRRCKTTFLIPREKIQELDLKSFPKHEDALALGILKEVDIDNMRIKLCREHNRGIHTHFISHKWNGNAPDTKDNAIFDMSKTAAHYLWFDYSCVPQENHDLRMKHLLSIANICQEATVVPFHANDELEKAYNQSVWCQLEAALLTWDTTKFDHESKWTIYDWNDLYAVLPGFLDLWVNTEKNWRFFSGMKGYQTTSMIVSMLRTFLDFHDTRYDN